MLVLDGVVLQLPSGGLLSPLSATLGPGVTLVCGDEGTGKSTLLRALADPSVREQVVHAGRVLVGAHSAASDQVFLVDPADISDNNVSVGDYWQARASRYPAWREDVLEALVHSLGLAEHVHKSLYMLSTGSRRKVMLAASIASTAPLVLWDQPFASLDLASTKVLKAVLNQAVLDQRCYVLADYTAPEGVDLVLTLDLG